MTTTLPAISPFDIGGVRYLLEDDGEVHRLYKIIPHTLGEVELVTEGTPKEVRRATVALFGAGAPDTGGTRSVASVTASVVPIAARTVLYCCAITGTETATKAHRRELGMNGYRWIGADLFAWHKHRVTAADLSRERTFAESLQLTFTATEEALT